MGARGRAGDDLSGLHESDAWGDVVAAFLTDLLDGVRVFVRRRHEPDQASRSDALSDSWEFGFTTTSESSLWHEGDPFPIEFSGLPEAAMRALERHASVDATPDDVFPSVARGLHDIVIAEVVAERLLQRVPETADRGVARRVAEILDYFSELAATYAEGTQVCHGVIIATDHRGLPPLLPAVRYPGQLLTRRRTPLLFDGTESALVIAVDGTALTGISRSSLPDVAGDPDMLNEFDEMPGMDGALTAASSALFRGVGIHLRSDRSLWIYHDGTPLFVRRTRRWKSIALESFATQLMALAGVTSPNAARVIARAAVRTSMHGHGAIIAIASGASALDDVIQPRDLVAGGSNEVTPRHDELHRLLQSDQRCSVATLARVARLDGATIVDRDARLLAYGAIVRNAPTTAEGARFSAAQTLSKQVEVVLAISQDGPITLFRNGHAALTLL